MIIVGLNTATDISFEGRVAMARQLRIEYPNA